jgi:dTMP kinase
VTRGRFITFEGGEGAGKSTQVRLLAERLAGAAPEVVVTREPGGSTGAEAIRELLVTGAADRWSGVTEALLMYAARRDHIERVIRPALERGAWVVCDRFADSTRAYQGAGEAVDPALISALEAQVLDGVTPDLTIVLDLPVEAGLARASARADVQSRFEAKGRAFHERLRQAFLDIARAQPARCAVISAMEAKADVAAEVWAVVQDRLGAAI